MNGAPEDGNTAIRLDRWLWYARLFKSRTLATQLCGSGKLRLNREPVRKSHQTVRVGDVLTFPKGPYIRVIEVVALGTRRGPAAEAQALYTDLDPPQPRAKKDPAGPVTPSREKGMGRPTKQDRRALDRFMGED